MFFERGLKMFPPQRGTNSKTTYVLFPYRPSTQGNQIPLKLFLDIAPRSSADITRALSGCFRGGSVYVVSFRFKAKQSNTSNAVGMSSLIF